MKKNMMQGARPSSLDVEERTILNIADGIGAITYTFVLKTLLFTEYSPAAVETRRSRPEVEEETTVAESPLQIQDMKC